MYIHQVGLKPRSIGLGRFYRLSTDLAVSLYIERQRLKDTKSVRKGHRRDKERGIKKESGKHKSRERKLKSKNEGERCGKEIDRGYDKFFI